MVKQEFEITILKWDSYNNRKDVQRPTWFRFDHGFFEDWKFYDFTPEHRLVWVYLLCEASRRNQGGRVTVNGEHLHRVSGIGSTALNFVIKKLQSYKVLEVRTLRGRYVDVSNPGATRHNSTLQDITRQDMTEQKTLSTASPPEFDFEALYKIYPRKEGKQDGLKKCRAGIKTPEDYEALRRAIEAYKAHVVSAATEPRYIKHFSSFMASWRDWLDPTTGTSDLPSAKPFSIRDILEKDLP